MPRSCFTLVCLALLACSACTQFPELDAVISPETEQADYPPLVALPPLLSAAATTNPEPQEIRDRTEARRGALQARANRLRSARVGNQEADPNDEASG